MVESTINKTELARLLYVNGFDIDKTKFKKFGKKGIHFQTKCQHGYVLLDENDNELENICRRVSMATTFHISSRNKDIATKYSNIGIESVIEKEDVEEGNPYCKMCPRYFANYVPAVKKRIMERLFPKRSNAKKK